VGPEPALGGARARGVGRASPNTRCSSGGPRPPLWGRGPNSSCFPFFLRLGAQACRVPRVHGVRERVCECARVCARGGGSGVGAAEGRERRCPSVLLPRARVPSRPPQLHGPGARRLYLAARRPVVQPHRPQPCWDYVCLFVFVLIQIYFMYGLKTFRPKRAKN